MTLDQLNIGESATISTIGAEGSLRGHLLDMGLIPGTVITLIKFAPMGDPIEIRLHDYELTLRVDDAKKINVSRQVNAEPEDHDEYIKVSSRPCHPGYGEDGIYH